MAAPNANTTNPALGLVIATGNRGKLAEIRALLAGLPVEVLGIGDVMTPPVVDEDGETFVANALKKARAVARATGMITLADDSGLEVDALGGRPGVRSARYAREGASDAENNAKLLVELEGVPPERRSARFRCAMALVDPWARPEERESVVEGACEGSIRLQPSGQGGFGYDPLFVVAERGCTMAELDESEKNRLSHRGRALSRLRPVLEERVRGRLAEGSGAPVPRFDRVRDRG